MDILSLRMKGEYSKILCLLSYCSTIKFGTTEDPTQLSPLLRLYGIDAIMLGYSPRQELQTGSFELLEDWAADLWLAEMPVAMAVGQPFIDEFETQMHRHPEWQMRILPIYPDDFRCDDLEGILAGHISRYRYRKERFNKYEADASAGFELVSKNDSVAFHWESWFLIPEETSLP